MKEMRENMQSRLMQKLEAAMPKRPEPKANTMRATCFEHRPIKHAADTFFHGLGEDMPTTPEEVHAMLWVFGELLCGEMEKQVNYAMKLATDAAACSIAPQVMIRTQAGKGTL